jgi:hypothetical protein
MLSTVTNSPVKSRPRILLFRAHDRCPCASQVDSNRLPQRWCFGAHTRPIPVCSVIEEILRAGFFLTETLDLVKVAGRVYNEWFARRIDNEWLIWVLDEQVLVSFDQNIQGRFF